MLVFRVLEQGPRHSYAIAKRIQLISGEALRVQYGSLYPALQRLEAWGQIQSEWGMSETKRRVRFYELTPAGKQQMATELKNGQQFVNAASLVFKDA